MRNAGGYVRAAAASVVLALWTSVAWAETLQGRNVDQRVLLGYLVAPEAVATFLPEGWRPVTFQQGPMAGATVLVALIDRVLQMDAENRAADPSASRHVVLVALARSADEVRMFVLRTYSTLDGPGAYGNAVHTELTREAGLAARPAGPDVRQETWRLAPKTGGAFEVALEFKGGPKRYVTGEMTPYSNVTPKFYRIYRYEQLVDIAASVAMEKPLDGQVRLTSSVPELAALFDGSEQLIAVMDIPVYRRDVYLP